MRKKWVQSLYQFLPKSHENNGKGTNNHFILDIKNDRFTLSHTIPRSNISKTLADAKDAGLSRLLNVAVVEQEWAKKFDLR